MLKAKVTTIGNSTGIVLPKEALTRLRLKKGDLIYLVESENGYELVTYDKDFVEEMALGQQIISENRDLLKALAQTNDTQPGTFIHVSKENKTKI